ncbi:MAG: hypothetical protein SOV91_03770 [Eubacteriales bacterium]|nr:hypothetical protein [Eubacteriales bacterium]
MIDHFPNRNMLHRYCTAKQQKNKVLSHKTEKSSGSSLKETSSLQGIFQHLSFDRNTALCGGGKAAMQRYFV